MTRRSISAVVGLLIGLAIAVSSPAVSAMDADGSGGSATAVSIMTGQRTCTHPTVGSATCYTRQVDGAWAREKLTESGTVWVIVGLVTFDEVVAAIQDGSISVP